jgi:hypothetical protein
MEVGIVAAAMHYKRSWSGRESSRSDGRIPVGLQTETGDRRREAESRWAVDSLSVISAERG